MARVLFDPHFAQAWQHRCDLGLAGPNDLGLTANPAPRLQTVCEVLHELGLEPDFPKDELPAASELDAFKFIVTGSRIKAFTDDEIANLVSFADRHGGLLIMSNHGAPKDAPNDFTRYDRSLVSRFGIELQCTIFRAPDGSRSVTAASDHPTMEGIQELSINNCSSLVCSQIPSVVDIPSKWEDMMTGPGSGVRAAAIAFHQGIGGRVFVISDSGFMGSEGTHSPGPGLIHEADNRKFLRNVFAWLAKIDG